MQTGEGIDTCDPGPRKRIDFSLMIFKTVALILDVNLFSTGAKIRLKFIVLVLL